MVKVWRCNICGDPYIGEEKPSNCPFCGAYAKHIIPAETWQDHVIEQLSATSRENLEYTLELELANSAFYKQAFAAAQDVRTKQMFKALSKIEAEHADTVNKIIKSNKTAPDTKYDYSTDEEWLAAAHAREEKAVTHYQKFMNEAIEPRVQQIFAALIEIEKDHIDLTE